MTDPTRGMLRLTRAGVLTLATVGLSLGAHVVAGGRAPTAAGLLLVVVPVLALALVVTSRRLGVPWLAAVFGLTQLGLHRAFDALTMVSPGTGITQTATDHAAMSAMGDHVGTSAAHAATAGGAGDAMTASVTMTVAHVLAAATTVLVLARGEQALWRLWSWLVPGLPGPVSVPATHRAVSPPARISPRGTATPHLLRLRGPPGASSLA